MDLQTLVKDYGRLNIRFRTLMRPLEYAGLIPGIAFKSSTTPEVMVECEIDESRYQVAEGYKITLRALDQRYGREHYYQSDLESIIRHCPERCEVYVITIDGYQRIPSKLFEFDGFSILSRRSS